MKNIYDVTLSPPTFPQADTTGTINVHDIINSGSNFITMKVLQYADNEIGDKIIGYLYLNDESGSVIKSLPYYITPNVLDVPSYELLFPIDEISTYGKSQVDYEITSNGNMRKSPNVNINLVYLDTTSLPGYLPSAPDATGNQGKLLTKDDYYRLDQLKINVPVYDGMASGQVVTVLWHGRKKILYTSPPQSVNEVMPMTFYIPRMEFLDAIGRTAKVQFKVDKLANNTAVYSGILSLEIEGQNLNLPAPTLFYRGDGTIHVIINYPDMSYNQTVEIRAVGKSILQTHYKQIDDTNQMAVQLLAGWVEENRGQLVLIDYAVGSIYGGEYDFSQILRVIL
ncbi:hypothetical protein ID850_14785 [Xenorhabdus sp. Flor]|uniref:hypothetical protein n=1 Tax=Xenorhabdus cabanillasii TaxID=351673 RepID=UPI00199F03FB|nr:hypothetical protein [Xenorhabdus sp. Flor]MBD2815997.1 hypothetical protein [Xenorhabdus sp. Flor]